MAQLSANIANVFRAKGSPPATAAAYLPPRRRRPISDAEADRRFDSWAAQFPEESPTQPTDKRS